MADTSMVDSSAPLFGGLTFSIIPTSLSEDRVSEVGSRVRVSLQSLMDAQLTEDIERCGGKVLPFDISTGRMENLEEIAYIVSVTTDFPDYYRALDLMKHVVKPKWISDCLRANKTKNPRQYNPDPALFMNEVVVCCGDLPEGDKEAIAGGIIAMGGQHSPGLTKAVTHLIALSMEEHRCKLAVDKKINVKIVLPHW